MTVTSRQSTSELVSRCRGGDERAWRTLVQRYENLVYSTALNVGLDEEAAAEVHQRVWLELYRSLERLRNPSGLPKWLIVTARRLAYEQAVRARARTHELAEELVDPRPSSQAAIEQLEAVHLLHAALDHLKGRCRELVDMLFFEEPRPRYEAIADRMGVAVGTLGAMRSRCLERLRQIVEERS